MKSNMRTYDDFVNEIIRFIKKKKLLESRKRLEELAVWKPCRLGFYLAKAMYSYERNKDADVFLADIESLLMQ